jgi:VanZ family protein
MTSLRVLTWCCVILLAVLSLLPAQQMYAGILEYLQHFSPGRHPSIADFVASALGALCGGLAIALFWRRLPV